jgi:uncharacterized protein YoxC
MSHETIQLICIAVIAAAVVIQTVVLLGVLAGVGKALKSIKGELDDMKSSVLPFMDTTKDFITRLSPRVESTVIDVSELARMLRTQAAEMEASVTQVLATVRSQTIRIDGMLTDALDAVDKASDFVTKAVSKPVRQLNGMLAGIKAVIESLGSRNSSNYKPGFHDDPLRDVPMHDDKDLFV